MPVEATGLFRPEVLRPRVEAFTLPADSTEAQERLAAWVTLFDTPSGIERKETELLPDFLTDVFQGILGYHGPAGIVDGRYTISRETRIEAYGTFADAALGSFGANLGQIVVAVEGKGPKDPLERPHAGRRMSAVEQGYQYAINAPCHWVIVTNLRELRLYHKGSTQRTFERFILRDIAGDEAEFKRFVFILGAERVVPRDGPSHLHDLLRASEQAGERLTQEYYRTYSEIRHDLLNALLDANPDFAPPDVLGAAQRLLDRTLFVAFAEDRGLLPEDLLAKAYEHRDPFNPHPIWSNFQGLFRAIDRGNEGLGIPRYNGGLFALHPLLDERLHVPDEACEYLKRIGEYHYGAPHWTDGEAAQLVDVEILGHIFEQSIEDLEAIRAEFEGGGEVTRATSRRKREGAFYTPAYVTQYIVENSLRPILEERLERLRLSRVEAERKKKATGTALAALDDPGVYDFEKLNNPQRDALIAFWEAWIEELQTIRVLDPACGSGAFLIELFDQIHLEYQQAVDRLVELRRGGFAGSFFDPDRTILQNNIYGVDLNEEAIEIARLSIWIKTAQRGKILTELDRNIRVGNSIINDAEVDPRALNWQDAFPEVAEQGGFDVVVGNPPYVRAEMLTGIKSYLQEYYATFAGSADLYVYFYELGVRLLRPGGRMSFIVTNKWLKTGYAEPLRRYFAEQTWVEEIVDLGHARELFPDADVFPCILRVRKPLSRVEPPNTVTVCSIPRDILRIDDLREQVRELGYGARRSGLSGSAWTMEPPALLGIFDRLRNIGIPLREYVGRSPMYGIKTGYNQAFHITTEQRNALVAEDPTCADIIRPYLRGQDVRRWRPEWSGLWLIATRSSGDYEWPWRNANGRAEAVFEDTYPSLYRHFKRHEARLRQRSDQGVHWWELRSCAYYDAFGGPKFLWKDLSYYAEFAFDGEGTYTNDLCFFVPSDDLWLLSVLNSPLIWSYLWRNTVHGKDEVLRLKTLYMEQVPIAPPSQYQREAVESSVPLLIGRATERKRAISALHAWLRHEFGVDVPGLKLNAPDELAFDQFVTEVKKRRAGMSKVTSAELQRLRTEFDEFTPILRVNAQAALRLEAKISHLVNQAYGLSKEEVELLWRTAPPRMPKVGEATEELQ